MDTLTASTASLTDNRPGPVASGLPEPYADNWEHLAAELAYLELLVRSRLSIESTSQPADAGPESLRGLYLSDAEVQRLLEPSAQISPALRQIQNAANAMQEEITARRDASLAAGVPLRLPMLGVMFGLSEWEEHLLVVCLAPVVDPRYEKFYAYLNDDLARKGPTLHLATTLLFEPWYGSSAGRLRIQAAMAEHNTLFRAGLLRMIGEEHAASHTSAVLRLDERIAGFLLGCDQLPAVTASFARFAGLDAPPDSELASRLAAAVRDHLDSGGQTRDRRLLVQLCGPAGTGRRALATAICAQLQIPLLVIDLEDLVGLGEPFEPALRLAARESLLQPAALYFQGFDLLDPTAGATALDRQADSSTCVRPDRLGALLRAIEDFSCLTFLVGQRPLALPGRWREHTWLHVRLTAPDEARRVEIWQRALVESKIELSASEVNALAGRFYLAEGQIRAAMRAAGDEAMLRPPDQRQISASDLAHACRRQVAVVLPGLAQQIEPRYGWEDIVLPPDALAQLRELCAEVCHRSIVYGTWGFGQKLARGKGLAALFSGPSGTGKTMAAEIIAGELELDLYRIDLSSVVSKYIGETEKNLSKIFDEAERGSAMLFFDEADALFGKRSEVKDAHDRYANIEISYLLQRIESYEGVVILATNLKKNMDEAFMRRLQFTVEFPFPDATQRRRIWEVLFPPQAPRAEDIDLSFLAQNLSVAGGNIKNIVLHAAFLAAGSGQPIGMLHLIRAARREYDKIGRLGGENDFGPYWPQIKAEEKTWKS
jgi:hypothetical protein